jgi:lipid II:glycine glycyltransferase (peptidoglycan interpeptide bridge formation enzyme)
MVVVETRRGPFRVVEMFYPRLEEVAKLADNLAMNQIVYMRQLPVRVSKCQFSAMYVPFNTSLVDLTRDESTLFGGMNRTCRYQVRKADRLSHRIEVRRNDAIAYRDFHILYNDFVALKRHSEKLSAHRLDAFKSVSDVFVAYFDGRPICGHLILRDERLKRVGLLLAASTRLKGDDPTILISSLHRWLHWYEMRWFKSQGMEIYDLGGLGEDTPEKAAIAYFKRSFGGIQVLEHNCVLARAAGRAAVRFFYFFRKIRARRPALFLG